MPVRMGCCASARFEFDGEDLILALCAAPRCAEQFDLASDILFVLRADAPVQRHDGAAAASQPLQRRVTLRLDLHPFRALSDEHRDPVRRVEQLGSVRPRLIGVDHRGLNFGKGLEQLGQHFRAGHELVGGGRVSVRALAHDQQTPGVCGGGGQRSGGQQRHANGGA